MATQDTTRYFEAVGRRKTASARVRITPAKSEAIVVNDKAIAEYFPLDESAKIARESLTDAGATFSVSVHVMGGGHKSQAEAIRLGIARALVKYDGEKRGQLKQAGFLKRDARTKERKKFGLRGARRAPQWSKR
ncbi:MAG TPA: 30S ribosomal protein S9 [Candidatus Paceibacterota bacterium]|nr:30S ribosomal protein S9 [Candidatus Paceibacterota bacterium]